MKTVGAIIRLLTFPGSFLHAFWEHLFCIIYGAEVDDARAFRFDELCGHVDHEFMPTRGKQFLVCFLPFMLNLILGFILSAVGITQSYVLGNTNAVFYVMMWIGGSLLTNLFPSVEDAMCLWGMVYSDKSNIAVKIIAAPICAVLYAGAYLNTYGVTLLTTLALFSVCYIL